MPLEKLPVPQLVKNSLPFHLIRKFVSFSQMCITETYSEPSESSPYIHSFVHSNSFSHNSSHLYLGLPNGLLPSGFQPEILYVPALVTNIHLNAFLPQMFSCLRCEAKLHTHIKQHTSLHFCIFQS